MNFDVIIIGGGVSGIVTAIALANIGIKTALIELQSIEKLKSLHSDGRAFAISRRSWEIFDKYKLSHIFADHAGLINHIRICDQDSFLHLDFSSELVDNLPLGYMIEHNIILRELYKIALQKDNLTLFLGSSYDNIQFSNKEAIVTIGKEQISADLIIAADGKFSKLRDLANIETNHWDYNQIAILCNVSHEKNHQNVAIERFLTRGPFAILPLIGGFNSSIVWIEERDVAQVYLDMNREQFLFHLKEIFTDYLGDIKIVGNIYNYPLTCKYAKKFYSKRIALIADSAHSIHPVAGQGLNIGIEDIDCLVSLIRKSRFLGLDLGNKALLNQYHQIRFKDMMIMIAATDGINRLFSNNIGLIKNTRTIGLSIINKLDIIKKYITKYAMGI